MGKTVSLTARIGNEDFNFLYALAKTLRLPGEDDINLSRALRSLIMDVRQRKTPLADTESGVKV